MKQQAKDRIEYGIAGAELLVSVVGISLDIALAFGVQLPDVMSKVMAFSAIWLPVLTFLFGLQLGRILCKRKYRADLEIARLQKEQEQQKAAEKAETIICDLIRHADIEDKVALCEVYDAEQPVFYESPEDWNYTDYTFGSLEKLLTYETVTGGREWQLHPNVRALIDEHPELLQPARDAEREEPVPSQ